VNPKLTALLQQGMHESATLEGSRKQLLALNPGA
jgi:hypothetical protein